MTIEPAPIKPAGLKGMKRSYLMILGAVGAVIGMGAAWAAFTTSDGIERVLYALIAFGSLLMAGGASTTLFGGSKQPGGGK
jgi:hypothetical protein